MSDIEDHEPEASSSSSSSSDGDLSYSERFKKMLGDPTVNSEGGMDLEKEVAKTVVLPKKREKFRTGDILWRFTVYKTEDPNKVAGIVHKHKERTVKESDFNR